MPGQDVGVEENIVPVNPVPTPTLTEVVPWHPKLSFTIIVCGPDETFINVAVGENAGTKGDASSE